MTPQEIFNKAYLGVIAQGGPAMSGIHCVYLTDDGKRCAIGHAIKDIVNDNNPALKIRKSFFWLVRAFEEVGDNSISFLKEINKAAHRSKLGLIGRIQGCHDNVAHYFSGDFVEEYKSRMADVARDFSLEIPIL